MNGITRVRATGFSMILAAALSTLASAALAARPQQPTCLITGALTTCKVSQLCGPGPSDNFEYLWSGPGGFTSTLPCIEASETGTYTLVVTERKSGLSSAPCSVFFERTAAGCDITGDRMVCGDQGTELCGPAGQISYTWTGPSGFTSSDRCVVVSEPGVYSLVSFDGHCESTCSATVERNPKCSETEGRCWMTGGGAEDGEHGKVFNWGGNVNPGCHPERGNWNHVDRVLDLHFQGHDIHVERCGNVDGIPAGSTSPVTPFNFIEFSGPGRFKGRAGNHVRWQDAFFFARVEDRAEPGSNGQPNEVSKDRYFLHVFTNPADPIGSTVLLVDEDNDPATVDPVIIDRGNLQLHITSCEEDVINPVVRGGSDEIGTSRAAANGGASSAVWFAAPGPNPARRWSTLKFGLPRATDVSLVVLDVAGRQVRQLATGRWPAGENEIVWDLADSDANPVAGGIYFARLIVGGQVYSQAISIIR
jgi:hypothetical protein